MTPDQKQVIALEDVQKAATRMIGNDDFEIVIEFLSQERERLFADLRQAENPNDVMKIAGSVAALQELIEILS